MITNSFKKIALATLILGTSLVADNSGLIDNTNSLVGIEFGGSSMDYVYDDSNSPNTATAASLGLKLGAETKDYRIFLDTKYFYDPAGDYDHIVTYGGALQYKFNPSESFNIFMGVNGGIANIQFSPSDGSKYRTMSSSYFGGDIGANIHLGNSTDFEIGTRVMSIQDTNTINNIEFRFGNIVSAYASLIFKWKMD